MLNLVQSQPQKAHTIKIIYQHTSSEDESESVLSSMIAHASKCSLLNGRIGQDEQTRDGTNQSLVIFNLDEMESGQNPDNVSTPSLMIAQAECMVSLQQNCFFSNIRS